MKSLSWIKTNFFFHPFSWANDLDYNQKHDIFLWPIAELSEEYYSCYEYVISVFCEDDHFNPSGAYIYCHNSLRRDQLMPERQRTEATKYNCLPQS